MPIRSIVSRSCVRRVCRRTESARRRPEPPRRRPRPFRIDRRSADWIDCGSRRRQRAAFNSRQRRSAGRSSRVLLVVPLRLVRRIPAAEGGNPLHCRGTSSERVAGALDGFSCDAANAWTSAMQSTVPFAESTGHIYDAVLAVIANVMREICGDEWRPSEVFFAHSAPEDIEPYRACFQAPLRFDLALNAVRFPARWLTKPVVDADPERLRVAQAQARSRPRRAGRQSSPGGAHAAPARQSRGRDVALALAMHRRTLNRRLSAEGITFQQALDRVRFAVAQELLRNSALPVSEIAYALGYADSVAFIPAFRRWTGKRRQAPGETLRVKTAGKPRAG